MSLLRDTGAGDGASKSALLTGDQAHGRVAVVDIGSSSVRMVVYDTPARLPEPPVSLTWLALLVGLIVVTGPEHLAAALSDVPPGRP